MKSPRYDYGKIDGVLMAKMNEIGAERFSKMKVVELERQIRAGSQDALPGRSQLRTAIHAFRVKRWPDSAPRRRS
jgi:hypothetical protein